MLLELGKAVTCSLGERERDRELRVKSTGCLHEFIPLLLSVNLSGRICDRDGGGGGISFVFCP